jgi:hypothetical protein
MRRGVGIVVAILALLTLAGAVLAGPGDQCEFCPPSGSPEVSGQIKRIFDYPPPGVQDMILVSRLPGECGMELPAHKGRIVLRTDEGYWPGDSSDLRVGKRVQAWLSMGVLTKCPSLSMASVIAVE